MDNANLTTMSLKTGQVKIVKRGGYFGRYLPTGHLVYVHQGILFGAKFDPDTLEVRGAPVQLLQDVAANSVNGGGQFDFSSTGTFVYMAGRNAAQKWQVAWLESSGKMQPATATAGVYAVPRLSPDGRKLALLADGDIHVYDLERDTPTRLTFTVDSSLSGHDPVSGVGTPVWADNEHVVFSSGSGLYWMRSDGVGDRLRLLESPNSRPWSVSSDGRRLAYFERSPDTGFDIWTLPLDLSDPDHPRPGKPEPFLRTPSDELLPRFSPDGHWIAYRSNETGTDEIHVRPYPPASGSKWQISTEGGLYAFWSKNGHELFYQTADNRIMVVDYTVNGPSFVAGKRHLWSDKQLFYTGTSNLDLAPNGKRFVVFSMPESAPGDKSSVHVTMLLNFFDELKRKLP
jgi:serine/threonine-protein kinase